MTTRRTDALVVLALLLLPLLWFAPQVFGNATLLPADNLYQFPPWEPYATQLGAGVPHNPLISDLILENYQWKSYILESLHSGDIGGLLWSPRLFAGAPFLAAGQHSAMYPLSVLFYILPLWRAYGVFTWLQLGIAAAAMYIFMRVLRLRPLPAAVSAVAYAFSGFFIVSVNFTMVIAAAAWLPLVLAMIEIAVRKQEEKGAGSFSPVPYIVAGSLFLALASLAGHIEITYYTLMVSAYYALWRLIVLWRRVRTPLPSLRLALWLLVMVAFGLALSGVQLLPLYELVSQSFREGSASLQQVRDWAWPSQQVLTFFLPDFFGNPTHHTWFDIWQRTWAPVTQNALGEPLNTIDWGVKNYVEGGNYLGIVTWLLAAVAVVAAAVQRRWKRQEGKAGTPTDGDTGSSSIFLPRSSFVRPSSVLLFAVLAVLSLLFAFGTPLYAILYYGLPGYSQLHSAFRWVFPYTLSMAALAGFGLHAVMAGSWMGAASLRTNAGEGSRGAATPNPLRVFITLLGGFAIAAGIGALLVVLASVVVPGPFVALADRLMVWGFWADRIQARGFADGVMAWSYWALGLARFGTMALLAGLALWWARPVTGVGQGHPSTDRTSSSVLSRRPAQDALRSGLRWGALPLLLILDLWLVGHSFNPATDPKLLSFTPPVIEWLQAQQDPAQPWRLTSFNAPDDKTLWANSAMAYGLEDIRGYDSIILRQYAQYMERIQPQYDLLYNRIGPIYTQVNGQANYPALDSRLLDLLGVRYVVTSSAIPNASYRQVYDGEVAVYENADALPRVFIAPEAVAAADADAALDRLETIDPAETVVIEPATAGELALATLPAAALPEVREARISQRGNREIFVDVNISDRGWLVFTDSYFEGWKAYLRPFGVEGEGVDAAGNPVEQQLALYRADGAFRAVYLPEAGQWTVRFVYSPRSVLLGLYTTFLAGITLLMLAGWWAWGRFYKGEGSEVGTVAKNSAVQMAMSLLSRAIDFAFAMLRLRVLSPVGEGGYVFAITFYGLFEILTRFGLGTLVTRDVALDKSRARSYLYNVIALRSGLWLASLPLMALVALFYRVVLNQLTTAEIQAIAVFAGALFFANIADAISAVFNAFEKMEYPAATSTATAVGKVALGALVILPPLDMGFVGLAWVSLVMNVVQVIWLGALLRSKVLPPESDAHSSTAPHRSNSGTPLRMPRLGLNWQSQRHMLAESGPLMLNHLLATVFWRISQLVLRGAPATGLAAVGIFSAGVKYLDGLNVIPSYFTLAIFPLMSRYAHAGADTLVRAYRLALQLLFIVSLPLAVLFTFGATPLIQILGGAAYLPDAAIALRIMIWSIPIGFINSVTQYVLIAVNQQRYLTKAFLIGVGFTATANLLLVPRFGYVAAAALQIPAELSLFIPFAWAVHRYVAPMPWLSLLGRPLIAGALNVLAVWGLARAGLPLPIALLMGLLIYAAALIGLGVFRAAEYDVLRSRLRRSAANPVH